jgi:hypothetical protein
MAVVSAFVISGRFYPILVAGKLVEYLVCLYYVGSRIQNLID